MSDLTASDIISAIIDEEKKVEDTNSDIQKLIDVTEVESMETVDGTGTVMKETDTVGTDVVTEGANAVGTDVVGTDTVGTDTMKNSPVEKPIDPVESEMKQNLTTELERVKSTLSRQEKLIKMLSDQNKILRSSIVARKTTTWRVSWWFPVTFLTGVCFSFYLGYQSKKTE